MATTAELDYDVESGVESDDISVYLKDVVNAIPFFTMFIIIILYILTSTTIWDEKILPSMGPSMINQIGDTKSNKGIIVTGVFLGIIVAIFEAMHNSKLI